MKLNPVLDIHDGLAYENKGILGIILFYIYLSVPLQLCKPIF